MPGGVGGAQLRLPPIPIFAAALIRADSREVRQCRTVTIKPPRHLPVRAFLRNQ